MRKINIAILLSVFFVSAPAVSLAAQEQENDAFNYRRSSLYSILISHPNQNMDDEIVNAFMALETPDKYNDHDLSVKVITVNTKNRNQARYQEPESGEGSGGEFSGTQSGGQENGVQMVLPQQGDRRL